MKKSNRPLTKKLTINCETIRALALVDLATVAGGLFDSENPCVVAKPLVAASKPCG